MLILARRGSCPRLRKLYGTFAGESHGTCQAYATRGVKAAIPPRILPAKRDNGAVNTNEQYATWKRIGNGWGIFVPTSVSANPQLGDTIEVFTASTNGFKRVVITAVLKRSEKGVV